MVRGLYTSALGMTTQMNKMDVVSNNIANADTTGFKKDAVVTRSFTEEFMKKLDDPTDMITAPRIGKMSLGVFVDDIHTSFNNGTFKKTGGNLDLAITGTGFFAVSVVDKAGNVNEMYTRDGAFSLSTSGMLITKDGNFVSGQNGTISVPNGRISIDEDGNVYSNGEFVDRIKMVDFEDLATLRKVGDNTFDTTEQTQTKPCTAAISTGYLENSNVNPVKEMIDMITVARTYEANQRLVTIHDTTIGRAVNDIARR